MRPAFCFVIPAKAGTQVVPHQPVSGKAGTPMLEIPGYPLVALGWLGDHLGPRLRGDDGVVGEAGQLKGNVPYLFPGLHPAHAVPTPTAPTPS